MNRILICFLLFLLIWSCKKEDDNNTGLIAVPPQTLTETATNDDATIIAFLQTHFYNYEEFETPQDGFDFKIKLDTIAGDNANKTPLINFIKTEVITLSSADVNRSDDEGEIVAHTLYYLIAREGKGDVPSYAESVITQYQGSYLDLEPFDSRVSAPISQYLPFTLRGYSRGLRNFKSATDFTDNGNGTVTFNDYGVGLIIMPSGLAYFDSPPANSGIRSYAPMMFEVDLLSVDKNTDFDGDGIPSIQEDLDGDGNLNNDNTDSEFEALNFVFFPNHNDTDDDQDGILTIDEIKMPDGTIQKDANGLVIFPDTDGDGTPDHLDNDN